MEAFEQTFVDLMLAGITVDLLAGYDSGQELRLGVRLRTFGKKTPKNLMVLAVGETFAEALAAAVDKANGKRWETLVWDQRPWNVRPAEGESGYYGF
jgi:hypothetical protein